MSPTHHGNANRLLVIDSDSTSTGVIDDTASRMGFDVAVVGDVPALLERLDTFDPTVLMLDIALPGTDGVELLRLLASKSLKSDVLLTGAADNRVLATTVSLGSARGLSMAGKLAKPLDARELAAVLGQLYRPDFHLTPGDMRTALDNDEFVAYFQPKASLRSGTGWLIDGVEALVRWQHPSLGLLMPDEFIPLADQAGLIGELTERVLKQSLRDMTEWRRAGVDLSCAVNLPPSLVTELAFPDRVAKTLGAFDVAPEKLRFELTELATMQDAANTMDILTRLRVKGFGLSIDDFGTGYSSITRLYQMPFDEMKIDKSLVVNVPRSREANTIVGSLIELAHNLGLKVCAEGVENRAALDLLEVLQCDRCQGYYVSRAIPGNEIAGFVRSWNETRFAAPTGKPEVRAVI